MIYLVLTLIILLCSFIPQWWVSYVMRKYAKEIPDMPGTGGELAQHLIERFELQGVRVEQGAAGQDHYDPGARFVRLSPANYAGKSLTAVAVAAHEVGHALQFSREETISKLRGKYIPRSVLFRKIGVYMLFALPILSVLVKAPSVIAIFVGVSLVFQLMGAAMYLIVLPEEWDASFNKALPILEEGEYIPAHLLPAARKILKAAALTYCAAALADVMNIGRWFMILRR